MATTPTTPPPQWLRELSSKEKMMRNFDEEKSLLVVYRMRVRGRERVSGEQVHEALLQLYRRAPNLRVCIEERDGNLWFKEMEEERIDFEVSQEGAEEVTNYLHSHSYPSNGPLWKARLVEEEKQDDEDDEEKTTKYYYSIILGFSHSIGDGHTYIRTCAGLSHALDCVLGGVAWVGGDIGTFNLNEDYIEADEKGTQMAFVNEQWRDFNIELITRDKPEANLLTQLLPADPINVKPQTLLITGRLNKRETSNLLKRSKQLKLTVTTLVAACGNLAFVDLLRENGIKEDNYTVSNAYLINMRRCWEKELGESTFGCYISLSPPFCVSTPQATSLGEVCEYAKAVHASIYDYLGLEKEEFINRTMFVFHCYAKNNSLMYRDLTYNSRGNLTQMFGGLKNLHVLDLLSSTSIHTLDIPWDNVFGTVDGRLSHTVKYNTRLVPGEMAGKYSELVMARLKQVAGE